MNHQISSPSVICLDRQVVLVGKLTGKPKLLAACRHNLREIQAELGAYSHIDPTKSTNNLVLQGGQTATEIMEQANRFIAESDVRVLRKDAVYAIEYIFSLSRETVVDFYTYFQDSADWTASYTGCPILSAVVHLDEEAPHMHVLVLPLLDGKMKGSSIVGYKAKLASMKQDHFENVAKKHGLSRPNSWTSKQRKYIAQQTYRLMNDSPEILGKPDVKYALLNAISKDPSAFQVAFSIEPPITATRMKTMAQIFTSPGKGKNHPE